LMIVNECVTEDEEYWSQNKYEWYSIIIIWMNV
jgi:hypothetical protein